MTEQGAFSGNSVKSRRLNPASAISAGMTPPVIGNSKQNVAGTFCTTSICWTGVSASLQRFDRNPQQQPSQVQGKNHSLMH
jgi:hypothetical protein